MKSEEMLAVKIIEIDRQQPAETKALLNQRSRAKLQQSKTFNLLTYSQLRQKPRAAGNEDPPHLSGELLKQNHPCILWRGFLRVEKTELCSSWLPLPTPAPSCRLGSEDLPNKR